jgi:hypothetical protein
MHSAPRNLELLDDAMAQVLREKTVAQRLAIANSLWIYARDLMHAVLRQEHPEWSDEEIQRQVARRMSHGAV